MENKLTDEEIVKALEICYTTPCCTNECPYFNKQGRNFCIEDKALYKDIKRIVLEHTEQKAEIERLTSLYDGKSGFMTSSIGDLPLTVGGLRKAVDEISRLLTVQAELQELNAKYYNEAKDLRRENAELQKQVDELKELNAKYLDSIESLTAGKCVLRCELTKQAVKDTAKEILITAIQLSDMCRDFYEFQNRLVDLIEVNYDVEVVRKTIIPAKGVEVK